LIFRIFWKYLKIHTTSNTGILKVLIAKTTELQVFHVNYIQCSIAKIKNMIENVVLV